VHKVKAAGFPAAFLLLQGLYFNAGNLLPSISVPASLPKIFIKKILKKLVCIIKIIVLSRPR
jgi:hypothetical protein